MRTKESIQTEIRRIKSQIKRNSIIIAKAEEQDKTLPNESKLIDEIISFENEIQNLKRQLDEV